MSYFSSSSRLMLTLFALVVSTRIAGCNELARGWGDDIDWVTLEEAKEISVREKKPIMVIIHKTWCGACKSLKKEVAEDEAIAKFSSNLVMVNTEDDEEPKDKSFAPDGGYVPRVFFLSPVTQKVDASIHNVAGNQDYKYFYYDTRDLLTSMKRAVETAGSKTEL